MCVWVEDADGLNIDSPELDVLYVNRAIKDYLNSKHKLGLAGIKGQGKTFLIKVHRKKIESDKSIVCLPRDKMVDVLDSSLTIDGSLYNYLVDYTVWVNLWKYSICMALIQYFKNIDTKKIKINSLTKKMLEMENKTYSPTVIFCNLLRFDIRQFQKVLEDTSQLLLLIQEIRNEVCIFFDKIDQGLSVFLNSENINSRIPKRTRRIEFWQFGQYALAEASYDINHNINSHVKVYYTIRQETLLFSSTINKDKARNINAYITKLSYSKDDLFQMYKIYINNEDDENLVLPEYKGSSTPSKAFLGLEEMEHGYIKNIYENVFDYIFRHTFHRPYDFMKICRELYVQNAKCREEIRHIVNQWSDQILEFYLNELSVFIPYTIEQLKSLVLLMPGNIFDKKLLSEICNTFMNDSQNSNDRRCSEICDVCLYSHPFSVMYNIGLIGVVHKNLADKKPYEKFMNMGNSTFDLESNPLPVSQWYFIHPAISNLARDQRKTKGLPFAICDSVIVGDECPICIDDIAENITSHINYSADILHQQKVFVSSTIDDLKKERKRIRNHLKNRGLFPVMSEKSDFDLRMASGMHSHDLCIEEVLKCKNLIFLIGTSYGGEYAGEKYMSYIKEIQDLSNGEIEKPSISLMEYYAARKAGLSCYTYRSSVVEKMKKDKSLPEKLCKEINFITHFSLIDEPKIKGNWIDTYKSIDDLIIKIGKIKFIDTTREGVLH